jgi:hypothetical protein
MLIAPCWWYARRIKLQVEVRRAWEVQQRPARLLAASGSLNADHYPSSLFFALLRFRNFYRISRRQRTRPIQQNLEFRMRPLRSTRFSHRSKSEVSAARSQRPQFNDPFSKPNPLFGLLRIYAAFAFTAGLCVAISTFLPFFFAVGTCIAISSTPLLNVAATCSVSAPSGSGMLRKKLP